MLGLGSKTNIIMFVEKLQFPTKTPSACGFFASDRDYKLFRDVFVKVIDRNVTAAGNIERGSSLVFIFIKYELFRYLEQAGGSWITRHLI